jgi:hypothetical protein
MSAKKLVSLWRLILISAIVLVALTLSACGAPSPTPVPTPTVVPEVLASKAEDVVGVWLLDAGSEGEYHLEYTKEGTYSTTAVSGPVKGATFDAGKFWFEGTQLKFESSESSGGCLTQQGETKPCIGTYQVYVTQQGDKPTLRFVAVEDQFFNRKDMLPYRKWSLVEP